MSLVNSTLIDNVARTYSWNVLSGVTGSDGLAGANNELTFLLRPDLAALSSGIAFGPHTYSRGSTVGAPRLTLEAVNPVPLPAAASLFGAALSGLAGFVGRRVA